jgi:hypothetical protein
MPIAVKERSGWIPRREEWGRQLRGNVDSRAAVPDRKPLIDNAERQLFGKHET